MAGPSCMPCRGAAVSTERTNGSAWVGSDRALARAAVHWRGIVGLDTEFQRTDTFFPIPGLYQVASPSGIWLVDPLAVDDWTPLVEVLTDGDTVKVLHSCSEDLELLYRHLNVRPQRTCSIPNLPMRSCRIPSVRVMPTWWRHCSAWRCQSTIPAQTG